MTSAELLADSFGRVRDALHEVLEDIEPDWLTQRPDAEANSIAWLVWHLTRVQDDHVAHVAGTEQLWTGAGWRERFGLPFAAEDIGYGQSSDEVGAVQVRDATLLGDYYDAVCEATLRYVGGLHDSELDRVVDDRWDPPVTLGVRLVSVVTDGLQHVGQAAYVRGLCQRAAG